MKLVHTMLPRQNLLFLFHFGNFTFHQKLRLHLRPFPQLSKYMDLVEITVLKTIPCTNHLQTELAPCVRIMESLGAGWNMSELVLLFLYLFCSLWSDGYATNESVPRNKNLQRLLKGQPKLRSQLHQLQFRRVLKRNHLQVKL